MSAPPLWLPYSWPGGGPPTTMDNFAMIKTMETFRDIPVLFFATVTEWNAWLRDNHASSNGVWLKFAKKGSGIASINHDSALNEALCYGWIDGQAYPYEAPYYLQKFTPRRSKSIWSKRNIEKVEALTEAGRMRPAGQAQIDAAKTDGRWDQAYDKPSDMTMPDDFQALLDAHPKAKEFYATLNRTNTYAILWRIQTAKKPETRQARMQKLLTMLLEGKKLH